MVLNLSRITQSRSVLCSVIITPPSSCLERMTTQPSYKAQDRETNEYCVIIHAFYVRVSVPSSVLQPTDLERGVLSTLFRNMSRTNVCDLRRGLVMIGKSRIVASKPSS